ncbi:MAG: hypothetical protein M3R53_05675 [Candidatus Eremiobacteraeota bacterium]|nr:hypothetical protein [Candidatus Eremiobacteraeota bacterium]
MLEGAASAAGIRFEALSRTRLAPERAAALAARAVHSIGFAVGTSTVSVNFSRAECAAAFAARYEDLASDRAPDFNAFAVEEASDAFFWADATDRVWQWSGGTLPPDAIAFFADNAGMYEFLCRTPVLGFHAATLAGSAGALALIGATTAGKTTTAVACVRRGLRLYSDERCILEDGRTAPFLRRLTLRAGGRAALLGDPCDEPLGIDRRLREWQNAGEVPVRASALFGAAAGGPPLPLAAVFVIDGRGDRPQVVPVRASDVMPALLASMASRESGLARIARVLHELRDVATYRLRLGPPDATARAIVDAAGESLAR